MGVRTAKSADAGDWVARLRRVCGRSRASSLRGGPFGPAPRSTRPPQRTGAARPTLPGTIAAPDAMALRRPPLIPPPPRLAERTAVGPGGRWAGAPTWQSAGDASSGPLLVDSAGFCGGLRHGRPGRRRRLGKLPSRKVLAWHARLRDAIGEISRLSPGRGDPSEGWLGDPGASHRRRVVKLSGQVVAERARPTAGAVPREGEPETHRRVSASARLVRPDAKAIGVPLRSVQAQPSGLPLSPGAAWRA